MLDQVLADRQARNRAKSEQHKKWIEDYKQQARLNVIKWRAKNRDKARLSDIKRRYGLNKNQYESMLIRCGGKCEICQATPKKLHVDHDHATGKVRGMLCQRCNHGLGSFRDNPLAMRLAADYIEKHRD